jgi:hypothetical protein
MALRTQQRRATAPQRGAQGRAQPGRRFTRSAPAPARGRLPRRRRAPEPGRAEKLMRLVRGVLPGGAGPVKRKGGRRSKPALLGVAGAGAAGMAVAARRRKRGRAGAPAETQPQPEPRTTAPSAEPATTEAPNTDEGN